MEGQEMVGIHDRPAWLPAKARKKHDRRQRRLEGAPVDGLVYDQGSRLRTKYTKDLRSPATWVDGNTAMDGFMQSKHTPKSRRKESKPSSSSLPVSPLSPTDIRTALLDGIAAKDSGRQLEARDLLSPAADAGSPEANFHLGEMFLDAGMTDDADFGGTPNCGPSARDYYRKARKALKRAADLKYGKAYPLLADMCAQGLGRVADAEDSFYWLDMAAREGGRIDAWATLASHLLKGLICTRDPTRAYKLLSEGATAGDPTCQYMLGEMHVMGQSCRVDYAAAKRWFQKAADQGNPGGVVGLAYLLLFGRGCTVDNDAALELFKQAAARDDPGALCGLAWMHRGGLAVPVNCREAMALYQRVSDMGDARGHAGLGWMYMGGYGCFADYDKAIQLFKLAADDANPNAIFALGYAAWMGRGTRHSVTKARKAFLGAMNRGVWVAEAYHAMAMAICEPQSPSRDADAQRHIRHASATQDPGAIYVHGLMVLRGLGGLRRNAAEALALFQNAARRGFRTAMFQVGVLYHVGIGLAKDLRQAERWYRMGANMGSDNAETGLGRFILERNAGQKADEEAATLLEHAAECDNIEANVLFAELSEAGRGCDRNMGKAQRCRDRAERLKRQQAAMKLVASDNRHGERTKHKEVVVAPKRACCVVM